MSRETCSMHRGFLIAVAVLWLLAAPLRAEEKKLIDKFPGLLIDMTAKEFFADGVIRQNRGPIELIACAPGSDKVHEVIVQLNCNPTDFNFAMIFTGFAVGKPAFTDEQGNYILPQGPRAIVSIEWKDAAGNVQRHRIEDLILNVRTKQSMRRNGWVFTGSSFRVIPETGEKVFLANEVRTLIATYHDPTAVLDNPSWTGQDDAFFEANPKLLPESGTPVRMVVSHPTREDEDLWAAWEKNKDDERSLMDVKPVAGDPIVIAERWSGSNSDYEDAYFKVVKDAKEWAEVWARCHLAETPAPALPAVDFEKEIVCALFCGRHETSGYSTVAREVIKTTDGHYIVKYEDIVPQPGEATLQVITSPWELIRIPRTEELVHFLPVQPAGEPAEHSILQNFQGECLEIAAGTRVIKNKNEWAELWRQVFAGRTELPPVPDIDFNKEMVIGVFGGKQAAAGATVTITALGKTDDALTVTHAASPAAGGAVESAYAPFHVVVTQRTDKPVEFKAKE